MSIALLIAAILAGLGGFALIVKGDIDGDRVRGIGVGVLLAALGLLVLDSVTIVSTKTIGVQTSFGKATGTLDNGFHFVAPWSSVEEFAATRQSLKLSGGGDDNGDPIVVRLANGTTATVEVSLEWQIDDSADITQLYLDYRTFDNIQDNVVRRRLSAALNTVFEKYDPLAMIKGDGSEPVSKLETAAATALQAEMPKGVAIRTLYLPKIIYADSVQAQINSFVNAVNDTKIAEQQKLTAKARQEANDLLAAGGKLTPEILYQNCLDMVERMVKEGKPLPAAFTCSGTSATAVVPVK